MVTFDEFKKGLAGTRKVYSGAGKDCPEPGEVIIKIPEEFQKGLFDKASKNLPPLPGQIIGEPKPWAISEVKDEKLYLYLFAKRGGLSGFKVVYGKKPSIVFYFDGEDLKYDLLVGKMYAPFKSLRIQFVDAILVSLDEIPTAEAVSKEVFMPIEPVKSSDHSQKDWVEYFELINGRKPTVNEFAEAKRKREF